MKTSDRLVLVFAAVGILLVLVPFFLRLPLIETRSYNPDELELRFNLSAETENLCERLELTATMREEMP